MSCSITKDIPSLITIFLFRQTNLVERMVMPLNLELSFLIWTNWYQTPSDYNTLYPIFLFDVSKQSEKLKYSTTDIQIKMEFNDNMPLSTEAYAVTITDRLINFRSDGNKYSVVI